MGTLSAEFKVLVVSANERLQSVFAQLLGREPALVYEGGSRTARDALNFLRVHPADVVISDASPADIPSVLIWREVRECGPFLLMLASYIREDDVVRSIVAGASGHLLAPARRSRVLIDSIMRVAQGQSLMPEELMARLQAFAKGEAPSRLHEVERSVLRLITEGKRDQEIAQELMATVDQVRQAIAGIVGKLG